MSTFYYNYNKGFIYSKHIEIKIWMNIKTAEHVIKKYKCLEYLYQTVFPQKLECKWLHERSNKTASFGKINVELQKNYLHWKDKNKTNNKISL